MPAESDHEAHVAEHDQTRQPPIAALRFMQVNFQRARLLEKSRFKHESEFIPNRKLLELFKRDPRQDQARGSDLTGEHGEA